MAVGMKDASLISSNSIGRIEELLHNKDVFVFDWDGTILDSMGTKSGNFGQAFCLTFLGRQEQGLANQVSRYFLELSGHPRKHIFLQILALLGREAESNSFELFNYAFERLNKVSLIHARIFPDAITLLEELIKRGRRIFISSSVPPQELVALVEATLPVAIRAGISEILGSTDDCAKGQGHLRTIMQKTHTLQDKLLVFGDDLADHELSSEAGVDCILVDRLGVFNCKEVRLVGSLIEVKDRLPK